MANEIRVKTSVQIVNDNSVTDEGSAAGDYTNLNLDVHADSRTWGGNYTMNAVYTDADVAYWKNAVVLATVADGIDNSDWTEASAVTDGTLPTTAYVVAVEYVSALGSPGAVTINVSGEDFAVLDEGQAIVIPMEMGEVLTSITIKAAAYTNGTDEATVNVMVAGV